MPAYMKIGNQRKRTLKDQMVRRVLKDNKFPVTSVGTRAAEAPQPGCRVCCRIIGREPGWVV